MARRAESGARDSAGGPPPLALVAKAKGALRIEAVDRAATKLGIGPGLTLADARARVPSLAAAAADPQADARLLNEIALFCGRFTPMVAIEPPDGLILDISGCAHLFGGEASLRDRVVAALARRGVEARAALADGPDAARAFARFARGGIVPPGEAPALARRLPLAALELPAQTALALARAGLRQVGDLEALPPATLSARFGAGARLKLDRLLGREERRITPLRPPPDCAAERRFPAPLLESTALMEALARLVADIARLLESRGRGGRLFEAVFFRTDGAVRSLRVETGRPCRDPAMLLRLFRERMDALADPIDPGFGFDALRLEDRRRILKRLRPDFDRRAAGDVIPISTRSSTGSRRASAATGCSASSLSTRMIRAASRAGWRRSMPPRRRSGRSSSPASRRCARCSSSIRRSRSRCWPRCPTGRRCASAGGASCTRSRAPRGRSASLPNGGARPPPCASATITASRTRPAAASGCSARASTAAQSRRAGSCTGSSRETAGACALRLRPSS